MMPSRSTPNLRDVHQHNLAHADHPVHAPHSTASATHHHHHHQRDHAYYRPPAPPTASSRDEDCSPPPAPPVRDSSSLRAVKYGPGHEKFPSWPVPAAADTPQALRNQNNGGSHRSKSWTDHTNYPKEKVVTYTRPYMKRQHSVYTQQKLKTVMERCEKIPPEAFESRSVPSPPPPHRLYLPTMDPDGKQLGDAEYSAPSPPERDLSTKPRLTRADLEEYARTYCQEEEEETRARLTKSGLEEFMQYTQSYEESIFSSISSKHDSSILNHMHQKQTSYAQSEGYHSYVSSTDSTSTPFLDRLRRDSEAVPRTPSSWDDLEQMSSTAELEPSPRCGVAGSSVSGEGGRDSVVTTSSGSASSSETLKWHGSMSDVSCGGTGNGSLSGATRQLIAHSARVQTPQRHHSESVLYMSGSEKEANWKERESRINRENAKLKLFAVNTYTVQQQQKEQQQQHGSGREGHGSNSSNRLSLSLQSALSVADRISELEKQQKYSYLDPEKKHKIPDPTLKAIQKKALLSFYERHNNPNNKNPWRSEPQLSPQQQHQQRQQQQQINGPQPPPKVKIQLPSRRASSASDYASGSNSKRSSLASSLESNQSRTLPRHQHSNSCSSLSTDLLGPIIVGASISVDDYVPEKPPERPPKNPNLRSAFPDLFQEPRVPSRVPSPDLPPPSPPPMGEDEVFNNDEPLPPPPPECEADWTDLKDRFKDGDGATGNQTPGPQIQKGSSSNSQKESPPLQQTVGIPEKSPRRSSMRASIRSKFGEHIFQQVYASSVHTEKPAKTEVLGFPNRRGYQERSSARYPNTSKYAFNGAVAVSQKANGVSEQFRPEPLRPLNRENKLLHHPSSTLPAQRASIAESPVKEVPPPLQPRQMTINQSMRARGPHDHRAALVKEQRSSSMSQSKSSYLAPRRDRDRIIPDSETGSYKRTMSPNGHALTPEESQRINSRETVWPTAGKETIIRRTSLEKKLDDKRNSEEDLKKPIVLPDVLPVNVKLLGPRSQQYTRPTHLSLSPLDPGETKRSPKTPPSSPPKSPSRNSPFAPLRTISMSPLDPHGDNKNRSGSVHSNHCETSPPTSPPKSPSRNSPFAPLRTINLSAATTTTTSSNPKFSISTANKRTPPPLPSSSPPGSPKSQNLPKNRTPPSPRKSSPPLIKPSLSPNASVKLSSVRQSSSMTTNTPLHASPLASPESPKCSMLSKKLEGYPKVEEGLQMIQRTEVILRVNTTTTDAASQTEAEELPPPVPMLLPTRKKFQEEIECEKLAEDFIDHLPHSDRLKEILVPAPEYKKPTDYVQGLFRVDITTKPRPTNSPFRSRNNTPSSSPPLTISSSVTLCTTTSTSTTTTTTRISISPTICSTSIPSIVPMVEPTSPLSGSSTYFTTSEPKAKFLTRYSQDMNKCYVVKNTKDLSQKKEELVNRLDKKLEVLRSEQLVVTDECKINDELGENVETHINRLARPHEVAKFRLHVEEVGKITSLLLGLSGRLARAENALTDMAEDHPERRILEAKRDKLLEQLEEAKKLKESIDRRSVSVSNILNKYLNSDEYADYDHFINMKAKLIMDSKEISDKIKLGEEQLVALKETLIVTD